MAHASDVEQRIASFLRPIYLAAATPGGSVTILETNSFSVCSEVYHDYQTALASPPHGQTLTIARSLSDPGYLFEVGITSGSTFRYLELPAQHE